MDELRETLALKLEAYFENYRSALYDEAVSDILETPEIREALSLKHNLETALRVNGSFHVTAETIASSGNSWANPSSPE